jgi:AcrR family transcriptional regulator
MIESFRFGEFEMRDKRESSAAEPRGNLRIEPEKIQKVLDTAARLFAAHGFDSVGIRTIAAESGVKMPSIYYHFTSKEALYDETAEMRYELAMARVVSKNDAFSVISLILGFCALTVVAAPWVNGGDGLFHSLAKILSLMNPAIDPAL